MATKFGTAIIKGDDAFKVGQEAAKKAMSNAGISKADFAIVFSSAKYDYQSVVKGVREATGQAPLVGCSSAGEFTEEKVEKESVACCVISSDSHKFYTGIGGGLKEDEIKTLSEATKGFDKNVEGYPHLSGIVLHDGIIGKGEETALAAFNALGCKFAGGSAGDDLNLKETFVFADDKIDTNAVSTALIASKQPVTIAVRHGHVPISPAVTVTKSESNIVYELDGKPAFEVWKEYAREHAKENFGIDVDSLQSGTKELGNFMTRYEAGLYVGKDEYKVRWPGLTTTTEGHLVFACSMPEGMVMKVMGSPKENQIASARKAAEIAVETARNIKLAGCLVFDCVVRAIILEQQFQDAVNAIHDVVKVPLIGFETYGELCMEMGQMSGFHNTTSVVMLIPD